MEFFRFVHDDRISRQLLQQQITVPRLAELCSSIDKVIAVQDDNNGEVYCVWGEFSVQRQLIRSGVRFTLLDCLNAVTWSITRDEGCIDTVIHCTINRTNQELDFIDSLHDFVDDWLEGVAIVATNR